MNINLNFSVAQCARFALFIGYLIFPFTGQFCKNSISGISFNKWSASRRQSEVLNITPPVVTQHSNFRNVYNGGVRICITMSAASSALRLVTRLVSVRVLHQFFLASKTLFQHRKSEFFFRVLSSPENIPITPPF